MPGNSPPRINDGPAARGGFLLPPNPAIVLIRAAAGSALRHTGEPPGAAPRGQDGQATVGVIIQSNYAPSALPKGTNVAELTSRVTASATALADRCALDPETAAALRVQLDWVHYKTSFRDAVMVRRTVDHQERLRPLAEIAVDLRQIDPQRLPDQLAAAMHVLCNGLRPEHDGRVVLERFAPWRDSIIWGFNRLFWRRLGDWEAAMKRGYENALPSGGSDANHPDAVADSVGDFWTLLRDLEARGQLPAEVYAMEIGVGSGARARLWLDKFIALDSECGTGYYSRLRFLLGDYSPATLDTALTAVGSHAPICSVIAIDAQNPLKTLSFLRFKILFIHLTNVYDNLPFDEIVRRDGQLYLVEVRPYLHAADAAAIGADFDIAPAQLPGAIARLLEFGPEAIGDLDRGVAFWNRVYSALRMEERLRVLDEGEETHLPRGVGRTPLDDLLAEAPADIRFHLSRGAAESFVNTVPLLHPRGYLQVQDIFVSTIQEYTQGFKGPGKLDASFVTWVNGAFLRAVGARAGFDVHFAPFRYRPGSRTQILYTTPRD